MYRVIHGYPVKPEHHPVFSWPWFILLLMFVIWWNWHVLLIFLLIALLFGLLIFNERPVHGMIRPRLR